MTAQVIFNGVVLVMLAFIVWEFRNIRGEILEMMEREIKGLEMQQDLLQDQREFLAVFKQATEALRVAKALGDG